MTDLKTPTVGAATPTDGNTNAAITGNAAKTLTDADPLAKLRIESERNKAGALKPPAPLGAAAYVGLAGEIVRAIEPHTEANPAAVLIQLLTAFGNAVGRGPHFEVEATKHRANLFVVIVGATAAARKGSSWAQARRLIEAADPDWATRIITGLSSGEGITHEVRDAEKPRKEVSEEEQKKLDPGAADKRLLAVEEELSSVLSRMSREGNTLSEVLRQAWDGKVLDALTKNNRTRATGAHVSVIGHVTEEELTRKLSETERANGFANRFLWVYSDRVRSLPFGGDLASVDWSPYTARLRAAIEGARAAGCIGLSEEARRIFEERYPELSTPPPGLFGAVTARGPAQVRRLGLIYALLEGRPEVTGDHLRAALTVWEYSFASARHIFGDSQGEPTADTIHRHLLRSRAGLTATEINDAFSGHKAAEEIRAALSSLKESGRVLSVEEKTRGRPAVRWIATYCGESGESGESPGADNNRSLIPLIPHIPQPTDADHAEALIIDRFDAERVSL
jgi:hypothetical protein